jgi:dihydroneopterin aldolase/2-amino-4-hydroxy-6-hydroxymethyldihydropteridine diphosphokinase/dihydropteroate synthase
MATLNMTPDSFSDGSMHNSLPYAISYASASITYGADIIDIGGYSTRPGAAHVSPDEEIARVIPVIQALRRAPNLSPKIRDTLISVDTFRPEVAKAAVLAGANCVNDVCGFHGPEYPPTTLSKEHLLVMRRLARDLATPVVLMHSRGDAGLNKDYGQQAGRGPPVLEAIRTELGARVDAVVRGRGGVRRWLVIVDPGIGFSKSVEDNLTVLRSASSITAKPFPEELNHRNPLEGYPQLIGASRKSFLGDILARADSGGSYTGRRTEPKEREWATAAAVACAVQQGAAVVRIHATCEMGDVVRVASALWGGR